MKKLILFTFILMMSAGCALFSSTDPAFNRDTYDEFYEEHNYDEALDHVNERLEKYPEDPYLLGEKGFILVELEKYNEAIKVIDKAISYDDELDHLFNNKAVALNELGRYEEAVDNAKKAIELEPDEPEQYANMGNALSYLDRNEEALTYYESALDIDPDLDYAIYGKGSAHYFLDEYDEAIEAFETYLTYDPNDLDTLWYFTNIYDELEEYDKAIEYLDLLVENGEEDLFNTLDYKGYLLTYTDRIEEANELYDYLIETFPDEPFSYYGKSVALIHTGNIEEGLNVLAKSIELDPDMAEWAYDDPFFHDVFENETFLKLVEK